MKIATLLPPGEYFDKASAGAVSLYVWDFIKHSIYEHCVLGREGGTPLLDNFHPVRLKKWPWEKRNIAYAKKAINILTAQKPDQVDIHNRIELFQIITKKFKTNLFYHNDPLAMRGSKTILQRKDILKKAHKIFCVSHFIKNRFLEGIADTDNKVIVMPNGVSVPDVSFEEKENIILFVGRLIEEKGALLFAQAVEAVYETLPDWQFVMIGANRPGQQEAKTDYEKHIVDTALRCSERFHLQFFTPYEEVMAMFHRAKIAVVPSIWNEAFGRTALEAIATKNALITTGRGGLTDIAEGVAHIDPQMDENRLAEALISLASDLKQQQELAQAGYARAQSKFDMTLLGKQLDQCRQ